MTSNTIATAPSTPWIRTPITDLTGSLISHQWHGRCADFELSVMECLEAYGRDLGRVKCDKLLQDFKECNLREKQKKRFFAMKSERNRQYWSGERSKQDRYAEPGPAFESYETNIKY